MNILGCLDRPTSGELSIDGQDVSDLNDNELAVMRNRKLGFVFQSYNLLPKLTAVANVELPLIILADEPTDNLDTDTSRNIMALLTKQCKKGITVIVVTHEEDIAQFTQRTIYLRDGKVIQERRR